MLTDRRHGCGDVVCVLGTAEAAYVRYLKDLGLGPDGEHAAAVGVGQDGAGAVTLAQACSATLARRPILHLHAG
jgi:hypothetical protein